MQKVKDLERAKRKALLLLLAAALLFVLTLFAPPHAWVRALRAVSEAAMVGGLADWFAVTALFRRIPTGVPFITSHTEIIPRSKDRIAGNLALFVKEKFLEPESLVALIRRNDPAQRLSAWLMQERNTELLGRYLLKTMEGALHVVEEEKVQQLVKNASRAALGKIDLSASVGSVLQTLTHNGQHQELLEHAIEQLLELLGRPTTRAFVTQRIVEWLKAEHPWVAKIVPAEWLGEHGSQMVARAVEQVLDEIRRNPVHDLRVKFDLAVQRVIVRLQSDPAFRDRGEQIKQSILNDEAWGHYIGNLWISLREWLKSDLASADSVLHRNVAASGHWLGQQLARDPELQRTLNAQLEEAARQIAPDFAQFLTTHIRDTVAQWDAHDMSRQIELNIGKDLQAIRINGTLVGAAIGLLLFLLAELSVWVQAFSR